MRQENIIKNSSVQKMLKDAYSFFAHDLVFVTNAIDGFSEINEATIENISKKLSLYDTGILNLTFKNCNENEIVNLVPKVILDEINKNFERFSANSKGNLTVSLTNGMNVFNFKQEKNGNVVAKQIVTTHKGFKTPFEFEEESDGTRRLILLCALLFSKGSDEKVYVFDEFEKSLHPNLAKRIVLDFMNDNKTNKSQLIITSHLASFMDDCFRKDEIFILSKTPKGATNLTGLMEYEGVRTDTRLSKNYLVGRFGGIPRIDQEI